MKRIRVPLELQCNVCHIPCTKKCSKCNTYYCSVEHQTQDWAQHKTSDMHLGGGAYVFPPRESVYAESDSVFLASRDSEGYADLYPNIMRGYKSKPDYSLATPSMGGIGLSPKIVQEMLEKRKATNRERDAHAKPGSPLNGRQLALQISANAQYGITRDFLQRPFQDRRDDKGNFSG